MAPKIKRVKRFHKWIRYCHRIYFGNPDVNNLEKINNFFNLLEQQIQEVIVIFNYTITIINKISKSINNNTDIINTNLQNISTSLGQQNK